MKDGDTIAVWFSCGAASAVAAKLTLEDYPNCTVRVLNNPIAEEDEDNRRFCADVQDWLGVEIETVTNPKWPDNSCVSVWEKRRYMSGVAGAPCTFELKKSARQQWEKENPVDWHVLGFTAEEKDRHERFVTGERENVISVLINHGIIKSDCYMIIQEAGIKLPRVYAEGYPNANCIGCVKATSPTYWNHVRKTRPEIFQQRAEQSRDIGARLVRVASNQVPWIEQRERESVAKEDFIDKNVGLFVKKGEKYTERYWVDTRTGEEVANSVRLFLDELPENAQGEPMKNMDFECGIFCMETT